METMRDGYQRVDAQKGSDRQRSVAAGICNDSASCVYRHAAIWINWKFIMRITKRQLRRIIRESILREQAEDSITVNALFKWDDYNYSGESGEAREQVTISPEEFDEWGNDDWSGALMSWASENLDGGLEVSDIEVSPEDEARLTDWVGTQEAWTLDPTPPRAPGELPRYPGGVSYAMSALFKKNPDLQRLPPTEIAEMISGLGFSFREEGDELVDKVARYMRGEW